MFIAPALAVGVFAVFCVGYVLTNAVLTALLKRKKGIAARWRRYLTEEHVDLLCKVAGGLAVALLLVFLFVIPRAQALLVALILTAIGVFVGLLSFLL